MVLLLLSVWLLVLLLMLLLKAVLLLLLSKLLLLLCCRYCWCRCLHCCCCCVGGAVAAATVGWSSWFSFTLSFSRTDSANRIPPPPLRRQPLPADPALTPLLHPPACLPKNKQTQRNGCAPEHCFQVDAPYERHGDADEGDEWDRETIGGFGGGAGGGGGGGGAPSCLASCRRAADSWRVVIFTSCFATSACESLLLKAPTK